MVILRLCRWKLTQRDFVADWNKILIKKNKNIAFEPSFGGTNLEVMYAPHLQLIAKPVVDFLFVIIELYFAISYGWDVIRGNLYESAFFEEVGHFERKFHTEGASPTNHCWRQKTRMIALLSGIKISAVHCLLLPQSKRVTDRQTDGWTDGQNYDSQDSASITACAIKINRYRTLISS